jgi:hypothetical protein
MNYVMTDYRLARSRMEEHLRRADGDRDGRSEYGPEPTTSAHRLRPRRALRPVADERRPAA